MSETPKTRVCTRCGKRKKMEQFPRHKRAKYGRAERCKVCHRELNKEYRQKNPEKVKKSVANWVAKNPEKAKAGQARRSKRYWAKYTAWYKSLKAERECARCGEDHPACLDFHHRDPSTKVESVAVMVRERYSREKILAEIEKCDCICANCHRKEHYELPVPSG